jgi:hypothetical protein
MTAPMEVLVSAPYACGMKLLRVGLVCNMLLGAYARTVCVFR